MGLLLIFRIGFCAKCVGGGRKVKKRRDVLALRKNFFKALDKTIILEYNNIVLETWNIAGWSSSVARRAHNPKVVGSNPAPATKSPPFS